jgi:hypothetical protein
MGITAFRDPAKLLATVDFIGKNVYVIPYGGSVMPQLEEDYRRLCGSI